MPRQELPPLCCNCMEQPSLSSRWRHYIWQCSGLQEETEQAPPHYVTVTLKTQGLLFKQHSIFIYPRLSSCRSLIGSLNVFFLKACICRSTIKRFKKRSWRRLIEEVKTKNLTSVLCFDFKKAFDSFHRGTMLGILIEHRVSLPTYSER